MAHPIYHLDLSVTRCDVEVRVNDFPVAALVSRDATPAWHAPPLNPYLVGELNVLDVHLRPVVDDGGTVSSFWDAEVRGWVRRYEKGDIVAPGEGPVVAEIAIPDELREQVREQELELPQSFSVVFANDTVDLSPDMSDAPALADDAAVLDYAIALRDLLRAGDLDGLLDEFRPKAEIWVAAYDEPLAAFEDSLREEMGEFLREGPLTDYEREDLRLVRCCGGRIVGVERSDGGALFLTDVLPDGSTSQFRVFVGERDGRLRVVR